MSFDKERFITDTVIQLFEAIAEDELADDDVTDVLLDVRERLTDELER